MRTLYLLLAVSTGCAFNPTELGVQADAQGSDAGSPVSPTPDASVPTQIAACHSQLEGVVLCLDFEDASLDPIVRDSSGEGHDGSTSNVIAMPRQSQQAAMVTTSSSIVVAAAPSFDLSSALTIELWFDPAQTQEDNTIVAHGDDFGVDFDRSTGCYAGDDEAWAPDDLAPGWHHIACTYDGRTIVAYVDGAIVACTTTNPTDVQSRPIDLADQVAGGLDDVHLYDRPLSALEVQLIAGIPSQAVQCPSTGG
ncbi:MAG TPA: LamG domain-containing protein [Kofleriaceae bacterium]